MQTTSWCSQSLPLQRMWSLRRTRSWGSASTKRQKNKEHAYDPPWISLNITLGGLKSLKSPNWTWFTPFTPFTRHLQHFHIFPPEIWTLTWLWQSVDEGRGRCCLRWPRHGHVWTEKLRTGLAPLQGTQHDWSRQSQSCCITVCITCLIILVSLIMLDL